MDRHINYAGQIPLETDLLSTNRDVLIGLSKISSAILGVATTVSGMACTPTSVPSMSVDVAPGEIYSLQNLDSTPYSSLAADTTHQIVKQGLSLDKSTFALTAPATVGYSVCYLVQASYQDQDNASVVLPYYNASNPSSAWNGPANSGTAQATERQGVAVIQVKTGVAATTGTQLIPPADSGFVPLYVVTVANGQTTITSSSIAIHAQAPILPTSLVQAMQLNAYCYALDTGSVNAYAATYYPAFSTLTDGMELWFKAANSNTGAATFSANGLAASPIVGPTHLPLAASSIIATGQYQVIWNAGISSWVLCNAGAPGGLTNLTAQAPLVSTGSSNPTLSIPKATSLVDGYLSHGDWVIFNSKGSVNTISVANANGVSATVSGTASAPIFTFTLGAITPSSVSATGTIQAASFNTL